MFFDNQPEVIQNIVNHSACSIFVFIGKPQLNLPNSQTLTTAADKKTISVEDIRTLTDQANIKQDRDCYFIINPADALTPAAQNALLKNLEEPKEHYHYILITKTPAALLPTIRSRSQIFCERTTNQLDTPVAADEKAKTLARALIAAHPTDLPELADKIAKDKNSPRLLALQVAATAIEILAKSYFKTSNLAFLGKLPKFIALADALERNGHVKLHIVADLC